MSEFTAGCRGRVAWSEESRSGFWDSPSSGEASRSSAASMTEEDMFRFKAEHSIVGEAFLFTPDVDLVDVLRRAVFGGGGVCLLGNGAAVESGFDVGVASITPFSTARFRGIVEKRNAE
jgi:hypothetical protein